MKHRILAALATFALAGGTAYAAEGMANCCKEKMDCCKDCGKHEAPAPKPDEKPEHKH